MAEYPDRSSVIALLEKLGDAEDAEVLAAARKLHAQITESGLTWDDLLVPDDEAPAAAEPEAYDEPEYEDEDGGEETSNGDEVVASEVAAEDLKLIDRLLARKAISETLREELEGYKEDIAAGEFTTADRNYLRALQKRLSAAAKVRAKE